MSRILYKSTDKISTKSQIITQDNLKESVSTTDDESEHVSLETHSKFTSDSS